MFKELQLRLHHYFLGKRLKNLKRDSQPVSFTKAKRIGILYDATDPDTERTIIQYSESLMRAGKQVDFLAFFDDKQQRENLLHKSFNRKDLNFLLNPSSKEISDFMSSSFDILLSLHLRPLLPLEYVSTFSDAKLKVGQFRADNEHCYDLMIDTSDNDDLNNLIGQVDFFIKTINKEG